MLRLIAVLAVAATCASTASAAATTGIAFGRMGGSIRPFTVTVAADGTVHATGPVDTKPVSKQQLARLDRLAASIRFTTLAAATNCTGTNPDVAATFIRIGHKTVRVHGTCLAGYQRLWNALNRAAVAS
jgi:hypothetical protein